MVRVAVALAIALAIPACASEELALPELHVHLGPARARVLHRVVALPASCGSTVLEAPAGAPPPTATPAPVTGSAAMAADVAAALCSPDALLGVDQAVRSALDFAGYEVVDAEQLNAVTASRHEIVERHALQERRTIETRGALFEDATPREQAQILAELGADALLSTRVWFGTGVGAANRHHVTVQVALTASSDDALVWARRCSLEIAVLGDAAAVERAARCAARGAVP